MSFTLRSFGVGSRKHFSPPLNFIWNLSSKFYYLKIKLGNRRSPSGLFSFRMRVEIFVLLQNLRFIANTGWFKIGDVFFLVWNVSFTWICHVHVHSSISTWLKCLVYFCGFVPIFSVRNNYELLVIFNFVTGQEHSESHI